MRTSAEFRARYLKRATVGADGRAQVVVPPDVPFAVLRHVVQYAYTDDLQHVTARDELDALFKMARSVRDYWTGGRAVESLC